MKRALLIGLVLAVAAMGAFVGCEVESAADQGGSLTISPSSIGLYPDQTVDLTASGGYEYTWALSDSSIGFLSSSEGQTVRYTNRSNASTNGETSSSVIQTITVYSTIAGSSSGGSGGTNEISIPTTESGGTVVSATAIVEHLFEDAEPEPDPELQLDPDTANLSLNESQTFTASGGDGEYTWFLALADWGRLTSTDSSETTYTLTANPGPGVTNLQVIYVTSGGQTASANIIQEGY